MDDNEKMSALQDALNGHSITDENGQLAEETPTEEIIQPELETAEESEEKVEETQLNPQESARETEETNEPEVAEDDKGRKYIPEDRFKKVYAQLKEAERRLRNKSEPQERVVTQASPKMPIDTAASLETELLMAQLPQFNQESPEYNPVLDEMGAEIYRANFAVDKKGNQFPTITKLQAARMALDRAKKLSGAIQQVRSDNRAIKVQQSDSGMASTTRSTEKPVNKMSLEEMEAHLKKTGQW